eukprot:6408680-Amphidinium_carterae.1
MADGWQTVKGTWNCGACGCQGNWQKRLQCRNCNAMRSGSGGGQPQQQQQQQPQQQAPQQQAQKAKRAKRNRNGGTNSNGGGGGASNKLLDTLVANQTQLQKQFEQLLSCGSNQGKAQDRKPPAQTGSKNPPADTPVAMDVCDGDADDPEVDAARREQLQTELVTLRTVLAADSSEIVSREHELDTLRRKRPLAAQLFHVQRKLARTERKVEQLESDCKAADAAVQAAEAKRKELQQQLADTRKERESIVCEQRQLGGNEMPPPISVPQAWTVFESVFQRLAELQPDKVAAWQELRQDATIALQRVCLPPVQPHNSALGPPPPAPAPARFESPLVPPPPPKATGEVEAREDSPKERSRSPRERWQAWKAQWTALGQADGAEVLPDLVMIQEHHLGKARAHDAMQAMATAGLRLAAAPAVPGKGHGTRAGVAVGARMNFGFKFLSKGQGLLEGRTCAAKIGGLVPGGLTVGSVYLLSGATLTEQLPYLTELAIWIRTFTGPFILGGDWQMEPSDLESLGWLEANGLVLGCSGAPTCHSATGVHREIDFYVMSRCMAEKRLGVRLLRVCLTRPHTGVMLFLQGKGEQQHVYTRRRWKALPMSCPVGCFKKDLPFLPKADEFLDAWRHWSRQAELWCTVLCDETEPKMGVDRRLVTKRMSHKAFFSASRPPRVS